MSQQARQQLVNSKNTFFQNDSQRSDLLDESITQTDLIALLIDLCETKGYPVEFTAIKSDHHDDRNLGEHCHYNGWCADCWPLATAKAGDYLDAGDERFAMFLRDVAAAQYLYQIGLAGSAYTSANVAAAGSSVFQDDGGDHVHIGAQ